MCESCYVLRKLFEAAESNSHQNYIPTLAFIKEMVKQRSLELFAGDCPLEEIEQHLFEEKHYTICHYFRCISCNKYYFIGACIRGTPVYKTLDKVNDVNFKNMLWGNCGTMFKKR